MKKLLMIVAMVAVIAMAGVANADITTNLVTHYEFNNDASEADRAFNSVTLTNDTLQGTVGTLTQTTGPGGSIPNAGDFGTSVGVGSRNILVGGGPVVGTGSVTMSTWFTKTGTDRSCLIAAGGGSGDMFFEFDSRGQLPGWAIEGAGPALEVVDPDTSNDGAWHHGAWVWVGGAPVTSKLYVDGVLVDLETATLGDMGITVWSVGARGTLNINYGLNGSMADVRLYDRALSDGGVSVGQTAGGDIAELFALGSAAPIPEPASLGLIGLALLAVRRKRS